MSTPAKEFSCRISIRATPEAVWGLLTDAPRWTTWNTTVDKIEGRIAPGEKVKVYAKISPGKAFPVKVTEFVPPQRMVWSGGMPFGLFKGERTFAVSPQTDGTVDFTMRETYTGPLSAMIIKSIPDLQPAFDEFAVALKRRSEDASARAGA